ncbi:MAG: hypothetical protein M3022_16410, partial [Actinomycetota bacterium]|nr:hypothetical protein [Actinomycetota bacterium]
LWPVAHSALAAALAWYLAHGLLGHPQPFFAADRGHDLAEHERDPAQPRAARRPTVTSAQSDLSRRAEVRSA